jgi:hypothetical protein
MNRGALLVVAAVIVVVAVVVVLVLAICVAPAIIDGIDGIVPAKVVVVKPAEPGNTRRVVVADDKLLTLVGRDLSS